MAEQSHLRQARRSRLALTAAMLFSLLVGGCELIPKRDPQPEQPGPEQAEPEAEMPPLPEATLPQDSERNRVAVLVPLGGVSGGVGKSISNAANLALIDSGGDRIRISVYDTSKGAAAAANQALADGNRLFLGPLLAEDVRAVAPIARRMDVPVIAFSNDASLAGDGVYVMGFTPGQSVERVVSYAHHHGAKSFGAVVPQGVYGRRVAEAMRDTLERSNAGLTGIQGFDRGPGSLRTAVMRLNGQGGYDAILVGDTGRTAASAAPFIRSGSSRSARILGTELWATETNLGATAALRGAWYASASDTMFNQLRTRYRARYGLYPYRLGSLGYDAALLAVRISRDWRIGRPFPQRALLDPGGFSGVDGAFRFIGNGIVERALEVREVTAGGTSVVSPAPRDFGN